MATSIPLSHPLYHFPLFSRPKSVVSEQISISNHFLKPIISKPSKIPFPKTRNIFSYFNSRESSLLVLAVGNREKNDEILVGEDSAEFDLSEQKISSWVYFSAILGVVLFLLNVFWIDNSTGFGKDFINAVSTVSESHEVVMLILTLIFALFHSGLASFRDTGEKLIGERAFRVLFAGVSLPLAVSTVVYFINHRYDGVQLWQLQNVSGIHQLVWLSSFVSFIFLYPSTFNLLEVAAVDKPKMHLWETGIMRITRHPQGSSCPSLSWGKEKYSSETFCPKILKLFAYIQLSIHFFRFILLK